MIFLFLCALVLPITSGQIPIPSRPDGFSLGSPAAAIVLDAHVDLLCPYCAQAHPVLSALSQHYTQAQLRVVYHSFPLPYHRNAFLSSQGTQVVYAKLGAKAAFDYMTVVFSNQQQLWNNATHLTQDDVENYLSEWARQATGIPVTTFLAGMNDTDTNAATRVSWKYGCSRTVSGTPSFFLNGVSIDADPAWTLPDWQQIIDPLLGQGKIRTATRS